MAIRFGVTQSTQVNDEQSTNPQVVSTPKHTKPRILLVDMAGPCGNALKTAGYTITEGSFGQPIRVDRSDALVPLPFSYSLPGYQEQEIIFVDTAGVVPKKDTIEKPNPGVPTFWQRCRSGVIDPRLPVMRHVRASSERILKHGGVFVVLASERETIEYVLASHKHGQLDNDEEHVLTNWGFLPALDGFDVHSEEGNEIRFVPELDLARLLKRGAAEARYSCTMSPPYHLKKRWVCVAKNKYGDDVAGMVVLEGPPPRYVLLMPRMPAFHEIIVELLEDFIAGWTPHLFPDFDGHSWVHLPEYEVPQVTKLLGQAEDIEAKAKAEVAKLYDEAARVRESNSDWYTLLRGTGDDLVGAVIRSLKTLGFQDVRDIDAEAKALGGTPMLREDIQIHDRPTVLVIDVKGVNGHPEDAESVQAEKHAGFRIREWKSHDVQPLTIINHQRGHPPLDRDAQAYRNEIIDNAKESGLGLMTTWDIFNILRNKERLKWPDRNVQDIFYQTGRVDPVPSHYAPIGEIVEVWDKAIGLVPTRAIKVGSVLAVRVGVSFIELKAASLHVANAEVPEAKPGDQAGVGCENRPKRFRQGQMVYLVAV